MCIRDRVAFLGLTFFGVFVDIFASVGFVSLCFGLCRLYASVQRGRAIGNNDYRDEYHPSKHPWLVMGRLRYVAAPGQDEFAAVRGKREYRRLLRRQLYAGSDAVMIEGIVERKSWLHDILDDLMVLIWTGTDQAGALDAAKRELDQLHHDPVSYTHLDVYKRQHACRDLVAGHGRARSTQTCWTHWIAPGSRPSAWT